MQRNAHLSPYLLAKPASQRRHLTWRRRFRLFLWQLPRPDATTNLQLSSWLILAFIIAGALNTSPLLSPTSSLYAANKHQSAAAAQLTSAVAAPTLPGGPTGQLLPPGAMATPYTFRNTYVGGQCTWYVAGRRQIPRGWGNARSWYSRARAAGWTVGTTPAIGAIAWTSSGYYGHVALVEAIEGSSVQISEMNFLGAYRMDHRWVGASSFKYIY